MLMVKLQGGLGNQMFQYALGRALSLQRNEPLKLDVSSFPDHHKREYSLEKFNIQAEIAEEKEFPKSKYQYQPLYWRILCKIFNKPCPPIDVLPQCLKQDVHNTLEYLDRAFYSCYSLYDGYWQNEKYFNEIRDKLIEDFKVTSPKSGKFAEYLRQISEDNSVSIHVRRGDYAHNSETKAFHGLLDKEYYRKAIEFIKAKTEHPALFIFSDDINWCKNNFTEYDAVYVENITEHEDIYLMSECQHNIIANSSFSWWGAWLNNNPEKIVVAPKQWVADGINENIVEQLPVSWNKL